MAQSSTVRLHLNDTQYNHIDELLDDRRGVECFRQFLSTYDHAGLVELELWLTLRGYQREFTRRRDTGQDLAKWNARCGRALASKYWPSEPIKMSPRKTPEAVEAFRQLMEDRANQTRDRLHEKQFMRFAQLQLPAYESDATTASVSSRLRIRRQIQKNSGRDIHQVPPRRTINYGETELATNQPHIFAARLIQKLEVVLSEQNNENDGDHYGTKVDSWLMNVTPNVKKDSKKCSVVKTCRSFRQVLSSDSGLSSIVNQSSEPKDSDSEYSELNGLKRLLIQDIESVHFTKIIYAYENEKFVIRVNSSAPTLADFKAKFHDQKTRSSNQLKFIFKHNSAWCEINDDSRYLPVYQHVVEARVSH